MTDSAMGYGKQGQGHVATSIESLCTSIPTYSLLDLLMACLLCMWVDAFVLNVWLCVAHHVIHDTPEAGLLASPTASHSV